MQVRSWTVTAVPLLGCLGPVGHCADRGAAARGCSHPTAGLCLVPSPSPQRRSMGTVPFCRTSHGDTAMFLLAQHRGKAGLWLGTNQLGMVRQAGREQAWRGSWDRLGSWLSVSELVGPRKRIQHLPPKMNCQNSKG